MHYVMGFMKWITIIDDIPGQRSDTDDNRHASRCFRPLDAHRRKH